MENTNDNTTRREKYERREVPAQLVESTPPANGLLYWILASPMILFVGWFWIDLFAYFDPIPWYWLDFIVGLIVYIFLILLPLGYAAHWLVTSFPKIFQHTGWDVQPLETVRPAEMYSVKYIYTGTERALASRSRMWMRAAQGWVYIEIAAIFIGAIAMIPLFFSAVEFGFGS